MKKEIERKFLVFPNRLPTLPKGQEIAQAYLATNPVVRVRIQNETKATLTIKGPGLVSRNEYEYQIPVNDAKQLIGLSKLRVEKTRVKIKLNGYTWEIDFYRGKNKGLVTAEVELQNERQKFKKPLWVGEDVTGDFRYKNAYLSLHPYSNWKLKSAY